MPTNPSGARASDVTWPDRLKYLGVPFGIAAFGGWFLSLMLWPVWAGIGTLVVLFGGMGYLALFVWPFEEDDGAY